MSPPLERREESPTTIDRRTTTTTSRRPEVATAKAIGELLKGVGQGGDPLPPGAKERFVIEVVEGDELAL